MKAIADIFEPLIGALESAPCLLSIVTIVAGFLVFISVYVNGQNKQVNQLQKNFLIATGVIPGGDQNE